MNVKISTAADIQQQVKDIYDYASYIGAADAALSKPKRPSIFSIGNDAAKRARLIYELSYDFEMESGILYTTAEFETEAFVRSWNEDHGIGYLEFVAGAQVKNIFFSYVELKTEEWDLLGRLMKVRFRFKPEGMTAVEVVPAGEPYVK